MLIISVRLFKRPRVLRTDWYLIWTVIKAQVRPPWGCSGQTSEPRPGSHIHLLSLCRTTALKKSNHWHLGRVVDALISRCSHQLTWQESNLISPLPGLSPDLIQLASGWNPVSGQPRRKQSIWCNNDLIETKTHSHIFGVDSISSDRVLRLTDNNDWCGWSVCSCDSGGS